MGPRYVNVLMQMALGRKTLLYSIEKLQAYENDRLT